MQKSAVSTFSAIDKDALLDQFKAIVDAGELTMRSDSSTIVHLDAHEVDRYTRAIESLNLKHGWHLDAQNILLRLDEFKKVKELKGGKCNEAKGWYGLKGACKRGKKGEAEVRAKESKVDIANRIRKRKQKTALEKRSSVTIKSSTGGLPFKVFRDDFKKAYQEERARQEVRGVVSIHADKLLKQFSAAKGIKEEDALQAFETLKKRREILTVIERGNTLMQWVE
jgi:hypothetical protein